MEALAQKELTPPSNNTESLIHNIDIGSGLKIEVHKLTGFDDRFNATLWWTRDGAIMALVREVKVVAEEGEPDIGTLVQLKQAARIEQDRMLEVRLEDYIPIAEQEVWNPTDQEVFLEDPRSLLSADESSVVIGLTALVTEEDKQIPYPAIITLSRDHFEQIIPTKVQVIRDKELGIGKNLTPVEDTDHLTTFLYRSEEDKANFRLTHFSLDKNSKEIKRLGSIDFSKYLEDLNWPDWIGTTMAPIAINNNKYLMVLHSVKNGNGEPVYSFWRAMLTKGEKGELAVEKVDSQPILTRNDVGYPGLELHKGKRVIYACGGIIESEKLHLFVNVGDKTTVRVVFPLEALSNFDKSLRPQEELAA